MDYRTRFERFFANGRPFAAGAAAGGAGLIISFAGRGIIPGRVLGDPLPLALSVGQITRGFTYFDWRAPLFHALFALFLGGLAALASGFLDRERSVSPEEAGRAGRIAAVINVGSVALLQVDAVIVAFWYFMAGLISVFLTAAAARRAAAFYHTRFTPQ
ncbi:MAG: hypothetical protein ACE5E7_01920 [Anaerolineae bacterium]